MKVKIAVTAEHIKQGQRHKTGHCPIALAIKDSFNCTYACVGHEYIAAFDCNDDRRVKTTELPQSISAFISAFDGGNEVSPFEFEANFEPQELMDL